MRHNGPISQQEYLLPAGTTLVSTTDLQSHISYCNPAFVEVSGYTREELLGQPHNLVRHPDMPAEAFRDLWATLQAGEPWTALVKNRRKNGDHYWVRANVTPVLEAGRVAGYMSVRTTPARDEVAQAEALYARMREPSASGQLSLQRGELRSTGASAALARCLRPGLGTRLMLTAMAGTTVAALLPLLGLRLGLGSLPALCLSLAAGATIALWLRQQALAPLREAIGVARRMSAGDLSQTLRSDRFDEVGQLARGMTQLNVNLQAIVGDVRREVEGITLASREIANGNLVAPELQLSTEYLNTQVSNFFWTQALSRTQVQAAAPTFNADLMYLNTTEEAAIAADSEALVNKVAEKLLGGASQMSATLKAEAKAQIERTTVPTANPATAINTRVADAIYFVVTSPEFVLQR